MKQETDLSQINPSNCHKLFYRLTLNKTCILFLPFTYPKASARDPQQLPHESSLPPMGLPFLSQTQNLDQQLYQ